jgi:hypothetical protein
MLGESKMRFTRIWKEASDRFDRRVGHGQSPSSMVEPGEVDHIVSMGKLVIGKREVGIAFDRLVEQPNGLGQALL